MQFRYRAITAAGERVSGTHSSPNHRTARKELSQRFSSVLECRELGKEEAARHNKPFKVKQEAIAIFFRRMAMLMVSGVPLADALQFMVTSEADENLCKAVDHLEKQVLGEPKVSNRQPELGEGAWDRQISVFGSRLAAA